MINNDSVIKHCLEYSKSIVPWHNLKDVHWKNCKPSGRTAYVPTTIEHVANIGTHALALVPSVLAACELFTRSQTAAQFLSALIYGSTLVFLFGVSTSFHCVCYKQQTQTGNLRHVLHRCDRAMIYIFIAGSYFPWLTISKFPVEGGWAMSMRWMVWLMALIGILYQQLFHEQYKSLETVLYIIMGLSPALLIVSENADFSGLIELEIGGVFYMLGVVFFKSDGLVPCAHAIWHIFVMMAATVHYYAILTHLYPLQTVLPIVTASGSAMLESVAKEL